MERLRARIAGRLERAGVTLDARDVNALAEAVLADAIRIAAAWVER